MVYSKRWLYQVNFDLLILSYITLFTKIPSDILFIAPLSIRGLMIGAINRRKDNARAPNSVVVLKARRFISSDIIKY